MPSVHIVIHRHLRVPVIDVVGLPVLATARRAVRRDAEPPGKLEGGRSPRREGLGQSDLHDGALDPVARRISLTWLQILALRRDPVELNALQCPGDVGVMPRTRSKDVVQQLNVDLPQRVGRMVLVDHRSLARQALGDRIQLRLEPVVGPLLPVLRARLAGVGAGPPGYGTLPGIRDRYLHGTAPFRRARSG